MTLQHPLTPSGTGLLVSGDIPGDFFDKQNIERLLEEHHFIVFKKLDWGVPQLHEFLSRLGPLVRNERRKDETVLELSGQYHAKEVLRGKGRMPLHRDGLLMQDNVLYVGILCLGMEDLQGGRTMVSDSANAYEEFPTEIKDLLVNNGFEAMPCDNDYYLKNESKWYTFKGTIEKNGRVLPNGGMQFYKGEPASYVIRFSGIDPELSYTYFNTLEQILLGERYAYFHSWEKGDLLLMDNFYVMHGREAYTGHRELVQMQVSTS